MREDRPEFWKPGASLSLAPSWDQRLLGEPFEPYYHLAAFQFLRDQVGPFVDYHPAYGDSAAEFRAATMANLWERFRAAGLGEMVTLTDVQKECRWHVWQGVTFGGGVQAWLDQDAATLVRLPGEDLAYRMHLTIETHREIRQSEVARLSAVGTNRELLHDLLRRTLAATMYARAATLQLAVLSKAETDRRGGLLKRWRARRAAAAASGSLLLSVMNVWGQWPQDWWSTESSIGPWQPDDVALGGLMANQSRDVDLSVALTTVADAGTASEILGWFTMAALDSLAGDTSGT